VEASLGTQIGEVFSAHWRGVRIITAIAYVLTTALGVFIATVDYAPVHRIPCYTDTRSGLARLNAPIDGQIVELAVADGSRVVKGDLLAVLSSDKLRQGGDSQESALMERIGAERAMIDREIEAAGHEASANHDLIARRIEGLRLEQQTARAESHSADELLASLRAQASQFASLISQGYVSQLQLAQKRDEVTAQESRASAARATLVRLEKDVATSEAEQKLVAARLEGFIENRRRAGGELERLAVQSDTNARQVIRAPLAGVVSTAVIANGQSVKQGQPLFAIAATNEPLLIRMFVPARAAAAVRPGLDIRWALQAYPREKFGDFAANIQSVSTAPTLPGEISQVLPVSQAGFIAVASVPRELRSPDGRALMIKPGMIGEALVPLERRTILQWLLDPIRRGLNRSAESGTQVKMQRAAT
jgi:membrane fusion protein